MSAHAAVSTLRVVVVSRPTWYQELLARHGTSEQARFFLETRGQSLEEAWRQDQEFHAALRQVLGAIPVAWRRVRVNRSDLDRFLFEPDDIVVVLGQDGLVANVAKYLTGQPVLGLNPSPQQYDGVLVRWPPESVADWLSDLSAGSAEFSERTMVCARLDDGQQLLALNEVFVGHQSHQSARYQIHFANRDEIQSSSGVIVASGTGSTGWASSIHRERQSFEELPLASEARLVFFTREAWPGKFTGTSLTQGSLGAGERLKLTSRMNDGGVIFGDGIEDDRLGFNWGQRVELSIASESLRLVGGESQQRRAE